MKLCRSGNKYTAASHIVFAGNSINDIHCFIICGYSEVLTYVFTQSSLYIAFYKNNFIPPVTSDQ